jgi:uncharacterized protein with ParB-like and HNH nuclease domain
MEATKPDIEALSLSDLFSGTFLVPMFQRGYAWKEPETSALLTDLQDFVDSDDCRDGEPYLLGQIIVSPTDPESKRMGYKLSLIDGQQRVTSLFLLFAALRKVIKERANTHPSENWENELFHLQKIIAFKPEPMRPFAPRLYSPYENSSEALQSIILMLAPPGEAENTGVENLVNAYNRFVVHFEEKFSESEEVELRNYIDGVVNSVFVTKLTLSDPKTALRVFEQINHRGLGLDDSDLLKNMLFAESAAEEFNNLSLTWEKIRKKLKTIQQKRLSSMSFLLRSLALRSGTNISANKLFTYWHEEVVKKKLIAPAQLVSLMESEVESLNYLSVNKTPFGEVTETNYFTNLTGTFQHLPALMLAKKFGETNYGLVAQCIEDRTVLFLLSGERTADYEKFVPKLMRTLSDLDPGSTAEEIKQAFRGIETSEDVKDLLNKAALGVSALSYGKAGSPRRKQRYIVSRVVQELNREAGIRVFDLVDMMKQTKNNAPFELDHVYPQSADPSLEHGDSVGNLVLLAGPLNRGLQASMPFSRDKVNAYIASNSMFNYAISLESSTDLPNSQRQVVDRIRTEWTKAYAEVFGPEHAGRPIAEIITQWDDFAVQSVSKLYWNLFRSTFVYL